MDKATIMKTLKSAFWGVILASVLIIAGLVIDNFSGLAFIDILFFESLIFIIIGILAFLGGFPSSLSLRGLGKNDAQYVANMNMEVTASENKIKETSRVKAMTGSFNKISILAGGLICFLIDMIMVFILY
ncbi:MAG: hypothetical protein ACYCYI_11180 [Saccharofermentanales bacterium]